VTRLYHVTSTRNRESIVRFGLDWRRMSSARGIAGSHAPEQEGCFLCLDEDEVEWFIQMNNTGGPVDVWAVHGVEDEALVESPEGHYYVARPLPPEVCELVRRDVSSM
jgi:hypothetical protein